MENKTFFELLARYSELSDDLVIDLNKVIQKLDFPRKSILLKKGSVCNYLYFIEKGLARNFFILDSKEVTTDIILEGELLVSFSSFISRKPSIESIELLEDSLLSAIHYDDLQHLYSNFPIMERIGRKLAEQHYNSLAMKSYKLKISNSTERYESLFNTKIEIIKRAPIGVIASYLGMSTETLSRIRSSNK